jgi:hypothetical protein
MAPEAIRIGRGVTAFGVSVTALVAATPALAQG